MKMAFASDISSDSSASSEDSFQDVMRFWMDLEEEDEMLLLNYKETRSNPRSWLNSRRSRNCDSAYLELLKELETTDPQGFRNYQRMGVESFHNLLELVHPRVEKKVTNFRRPIPPEERLAITLRFLATGDYLKHLQITF